MARFGDFFLQCLWNEGLAEARVDRHDQMMSILSITVTCGSGAGVPGLETRPDLRHNAD
jgi:hypothetical protein